MKSPIFCFNSASRFVFALMAALMLAAALAGCAGKTPPSPVAEVQPADASYGPPVGFESPELFLRSLNPRHMGVNSWRELAPTLHKSLAYVNAKPRDDYAVRRDGLNLTWGQMAHTLRRLEALLPALDKDPDLFLREFVWAPVDGGIKYSGYYEPMVKASKTKKPGYMHPVYCKPPELDKYVGRGKKYYDRREIDENGRLHGRGLELAYAADPVDVFYLQIQGSGRLAFEDGECIIVNYDGQNGHKYKSSGKIMREKGLLSEGHIFEQRQWFKNNPHRVSEILRENPSYVFFKEGSRGATGAMGEVIVPWLSIATDRRFIPLGAVVAYGVNIPDQRQGRIPLRAIGFSQDVGGAIKENRIDIFCGSDFRGEYVASMLDAKGPAWVLLSKDVAPTAMAAAPEALQNKTETARADARPVAARVEAEKAGRKIKPGKAGSAGGRAAAEAVRPASKAAGPSGKIAAQSVKPAADKSGKKAAAAPAGKSVRAGKAAGPDKAKASARGKAPAAEKTSGQGKTTALADKSGKKKVPAARK